MPTFSLSLFWRLFGISVPTWVLIALTVVCAACAAAVCVRRGFWGGKWCGKGCLAGESVGRVENRDSVKCGRWQAGNSWQVWFRAGWVEYLFVILWLVWFCREMGSDHRVNLLPGHSIDEIKVGFVETYYEKIDNVLLYVPFGVLTLLSLPWRVRRPFWIAVGIGLAVSVTAELGQWVFMLGMCETDDVICNTAGQFIGALLALPVVWRIRRKKMLED